jgi:hypothetical protein
VYVGDMFSDFLHLLDGAQDGPVVRQEDRVRWALCQAALLVDAGGRHQADFLGIADELEATPDCLLPGHTTHWSERQIHLLRRGRIDELGDEAIARQLAHSALVERAFGWQLAADLLRTAFLLSRAEQQVATDLLAEQQLIRTRLQAVGASSPSVLVALKIGFDALYRKVREELMRSRDQLAGSPAECPWSMDELLAAPEACRMPEQDRQGSMSAR